MIGPRENCIPVCHQRLVDPERALAHAHLQLNLVGDAQDSEINRVVRLSVRSVRGLRFRWKLSEKFSVLGFEQIWVDEHPDGVYNLEATYVPSILLHKNLPMLTNCFPIPYTQRVLEGVIDHNRARGLLGPRGARGGRANDIKTRGYVRSRVGKDGRAGKVGR